MKTLILLTVEYEGKQLTVLAEDEIEWVSGGQNGLPMMQSTSLPGVTVNTGPTLELFRSLLLPASDDDGMLVWDTITRH